MTTTTDDAPLSRERGGIPFFASVQAGCTPMGLWTRAGNNRLSLAQPMLRNPEPPHPTGCLSGGTPRFGRDYVPRYPAICWYVYSTIHAVGVYVSLGPCIPARPRNSPRFALDPLPISSSTFSRRCSAFFMFLVPLLRSRSINLKHLLNPASCIIRLIAGA